MFVWPSSIMTSKTIIASNTEETSNIRLRERHFKLMKNWTELHLSCVQVLAVTKRSINIVCEYKCYVLVVVTLYWCQNSSG